MVDAERPVEMLQDAAAIDLQRAVVQATLERNHDVLGMQVSGLSHADSLLQPQPRGNCLNWVVGHMASNRDIMLHVLGSPAVFTEGQLDHYVRGSKPIVRDEDGVVPLAGLLDAFAVQQERLRAALAAASCEALAQASFLDGMNVVEALQFLTWHDTYHLGQTDQLRQLSGVNDTVIP